MAVALLSAGQAAAQETYENAKIAGEDLNGTARYVGMGGALDALGADISTIGSNPAGIARFRKSKIEGTMSVVSQANAAEYPEINKQIVETVMNNLTHANLKNVRNFYAYAKACISSAYYMPIPAEKQSYAPTYNIAEYESTSVLDEEWWVRWRQSKTLPISYRWASRQLPMLYLHSAYCLHAQAISTYYPVTK